MSRRVRRRHKEEPDDDEDVRATENIRMKFAERAKKREIGIALRAASHIFVNASNAAMKDIGSEGEEQFCLFATSFIGFIWMDSVWSLIHNEYSDRRGMSVANLRTFKLQLSEKAFS